MKFNTFPYITFTKNALVLLALVSALFATSCKKDDPELKPDQHRYFPLQTGMWREYKVDSVIYRGSTDYPNDTLHFMIREEVDTTFRDNTGAQNYIVKTLYRENQNDAWTLRYVTAALKTELRAEMLYNNDRYVKMIFPVIKNQGWNANMYNDEDPDNFKKSKYISVHQKETVNGVTLDSVSTVEVQNYKDFISDTSETEKYATGIGLISHSWTGLEKQMMDGKPVIRGFIYNKTLTAHGK